MPSVTVNGLEMAYLLDGGGTETIALINGIADEKESFAFQVEAFAAAGYRVLCLDNRGVGGTGKPDGPYTTRQMAEDAKGLVDALGIDDVHLVGFSMGGMIAQEYACAFGDGLRSVSLVASYAAPGPFCAKLFDMWAEITRASGVETVVREVLLWCFTPAFYEDQRALAQEFDDGIAGIRLTAEGFLAQLAAIQRHDTTERLGALGLPTLVLAGEADMLIPPIQSRRLHAAIPGAEWVTVQGGHAALWEFPETFNAAVLDFIGRH